MNRTLKKSLRWIISLVIIVFLVMFVLVFTNARARGVKSLVLFLILVVVGLTVQLTAGWTEILQFFPLLLVLVTVLGWVLPASDKDTVLNHVASLFPLLDAKSIKGLNGSWWALVVGALTSLWSGLGAVRTTQTAFNSVWEVPIHKRPGFVAQVLRSLAVLATVGAPVRAFVFSREGLAAPDLLLGFDALDYWNLEPSSAFPQIVSGIYSGTAMLNRLLERRGRKVGCIVSGGLEDYFKLERGIQTYLSFSYSDRLHVATHYHNEPLVPRERIRGITERVDFEGGVVVALAEGEVEAATCARETPTRTMPPTRLPSMTAPSN